MKALKKSVIAPVNFINVKMNNRKEKFRKLSPENFSDEETSGSINSGIYYKGNKFITHSNLHHRHSAIQTFHIYQKITILLLGGA